jgi:hypothetical protein
MNTRVVLRVNGWMIVKHIDKSDVEEKTKFKGEGL